MKCSMSDCLNPSFGKGLCCKHYTRLKRNGSPDISKRGPAGSGWVNPADGYRYLHITGRGKHIAEHRLVMEKHLGRPLLATEEVHHINHVRTDNRVENLEVLSRSEHGQRHLKNGSDADHKWCPTCARLLPRTSFNMSRNERGGGLSGRCSSCNKQHCREWYHEKNGREWMKNFSIEKKARVSISQQQSN